MTEQTRPETPALIAALGASACCLIPVLALAIGLGGSAGMLARLDILYFPLAGISIMLLLWAWWRVVIAPRRRGEPADRGTMRRLQWMSAGSVLALSLPWLLPLLSCAECH